MKNLQRSDLTAPERAEAGIALAHLCTRGDRILDEVLSIEKMQFCFVPAGPFCMGSPENDRMAFDAGRPFTDNMPLEYDYWLSRFPITQAQFAEFVNAGGYKEKDFRTEAISAKVWQKGKVKVSFDDKPREGPEDFSAPFTLPNHPVVGPTRTSRNQKENFQRIEKPNV